MNDAFSRTEVSREIMSLGVELMSSGRLREAVLTFRKALALADDCQEAGLLLGHCLHLLGKYQEALVVYERMRAVSPDCAAIWNNRGNALLELGRYDQSVDSYRRALELSPDLHDARVAMGSCYQFMGRPEQALECCEAVLKSDAGHAEAHWNRALLLLLKGDYAEGWREYEWRWKKRAFTSPVRHFSQPRWAGEDLAGKKLLVHAEQGFGDTLQFCRFIPNLARLGAKVIFECQPQLVSLLESLAGCVEAVPMGANLPDFDMHVPLLSLPLLLGINLQNLTNQVPYVSPSEAKQSLWHAIVSHGAGKKVGLCWSGKSYPDPGRSCPVHDLAALAAVDGMVWHSLQVGWEEPLPFVMSDHTGMIKDFEDTAALIRSLDLVITIDTAVAHLAGALGKPVWIMLPYAPDWRWLLERNDSPWYPTARLFRQQRSAAWAEVINQVADGLRRWHKIDACPAPD